MSDHSARPRIESVGTFVLTVELPEEDPVLTPCGLTDCAEGDNDYEVIEVWTGSDSVTIDRDITEVSTECTTYQLIAFYSVIAGDISLNSTVPTDDAPVTGWDADYSFTGSTSADPMYEDEWTAWEDMSVRAAAGCGVLDVVNGFAQKLVFYPIPSGTVVTANAPTGDDQQMAVALVKGGGATVPNINTLAKGGISGGFSGHSSSVAYLGGGVWSSPSTDGESLYIQDFAAWQGKSKNCFINFGCGADGTYPTMSSPEMIHAGYTNPTTAWSGPPCVSAADTVITEGAMWMEVGGLGTLSGGPGAFGGESLYTYMEPYPCGPVGFAALEAGWPP